MSANKYTLIDKLELRAKNEEIDRLRLELAKTVELHRFKWNDENIRIFIAENDALREKVERMREGVRKLIEEHEYEAFCMSPKEVVVELKKILTGDDN